jgi:hypothetical protein
MKHHYSCLLIFSAMLITACSNHQKKNNNEGFEIDSIEAKEQKMRDAYEHDTVKIASENYYIEVHRQPSDSMPKVKNESGLGFTDNKITLTIKRANGLPFFHKTFKKIDFKHVVEADFMKDAILEGIVFDKVENEQFSFSGSVSYPQSDMFVAVRILVSRAGAVSIQKDENADIGSDEDSIAK